MKTKALLALNNFIHINKYGKKPLMHLMNVLYNSYCILKELGEYPSSFEWYLCDLQGQYWDKEIWEYWENLYRFKGELDDFRKTMPLQEAIQELVEEYDL